ncbi:MAG: dephospho-CoA kinase [Rhizobiaceae bacterium]|jgi:dephospho-CoA kinase|nr:dephospho-CoA kinase [Rhizobiaceae bacterium]
MIVLGLTGSIGMGKSTTSAMFRDEGVPVLDSDAVVHDLYRGDAVARVEALFPGVSTDGVIDRAKLAADVLGRPERLRALEAVIHPLVRAAQERFLEEARAEGHAIAVLDVPLLYETGADARVDQVLVVTAPQDIQRDRVLARPGMTREKLDAILARQMPDAEKRARADHVIDTSRGIEAARADVRTLIERLLKTA